MNATKRLLLNAIVSIAALSPLASFAADNSTPDQLIRQLAIETLDAVKSDKAIQAGDANKVMELVNTKVMPHVDFQRITSSAVGRFWRQATPEQKQRLQDEFKTLLVRTYASALAAYSEQKFDFRPLRAKPTDTDVTVNVRVIQPGAQAVTIDYSMEKTGSGWKVYDVMVGGVSLVANYRTEFSNTVRNAGIDGLIKNLQATNHPSDPQGKK